jgi:O-antigen/teichoic acid export membrane protein
MRKSIGTIGIWALAVVVLSVVLNFSSNGFAAAVEQPLSNYEMKMNELEIEMIKENVRLWK